MTQQDIHNLLNGTDGNLIEGYLTLQQYYESLYGEDTVLLMEVGSFFEIYGVDNEEHQIGRPREIADLLNLQLTRKNKTIKENSAKNPLMAGFPTATFDRYVSRLVQEKQYTIVIIRQEGLPPKVTRYIGEILSPGVNIDYCTDHKDNYISSLLVTCHHGIFSVGYAGLDVSTGNTVVFEGHSTAEDKTAALDELFRLLQTHQTTEIIFVPGSSEVQQEEVSQYLEFGDITHVHTRTKRLPIGYQNELFRRAYVVQSFLSPIEFLDLEKQPLTSEALAHLLEFVVAHDHKVIHELQTPTIIDTSHYVYLGNNPLEQLNIISRDSRELTVLSLFDHTTTSIGKRLFYDRLTNPITDKATIESRYDLSDWLSPISVQIGDELKHVYDLERIARRIALSRLHPFEINFLYDSLSAAASIFDAILAEQNPAILPDVLSERGALADCISHIETVFCLDETHKVTRQMISSSLFQPGFHRKLDELGARQHILFEKLQEIKMAFVQLLSKQHDRDHTDFVVVKQLEKEGYYISMTRSRYALIEDAITQTFISLDGTVYSLGDFSYKIQKSNVKITADVMEHISEELVIVQKKITALVKELFIAQLAVLHTHYASLLTLITTSIAHIDVAVSNVKASALLRLTRPEIVLGNDDASYISLLDIRHPLVEATETKGIYVPNHVVLGDRSQYTAYDASSVMATSSNHDVRGLLLYGINSSGKSSLMKSIGVALILAQSGLYVPATTMRFSLCTELFTRIVAKDNFEKGLSSFAVEMVELKNIFNRCGSKSLILGDEISHGTETLSAIAIVGATIKRLVEKKSLFLFTTHLHQIHQCNILSEESSHVASAHMQVHYDKDADQLVFDRVLQAGNGSSIYGLEFAQSLHMDEPFLQYATTIRKSLTDDYSDIELLVKKERSIYNKHVYLSSCAICSQRVEDVHHIVPQKEADDAGNIGHFHKNHTYNLLPICKSCHKRIHDEEIQVNGFVMTSKGLQLLFEER